MDAKQFLEKFGNHEAEQVSQAAGTTLAYFKQIAYGHRFPSRGLAKRLVDASDNRLDIMKLLNLAA